MDSILVTGGSGFIGSHIVEALVRRGNRVKCLVRGTSRVELLREWGVDLVVGDFQRPQTIRSALEGVDLVFHAAGLIKAVTRAELMRANADATAALAKACAAQPKPPRLVLVSSVAAGGPAARGQIKIESDPSSPLSHYGRSKLAGEAAAIEVADRVPITIVRPGIVFGPRDTTFVKIPRALRRLGLHATAGWRQPPLSYIHVSDLVEIMLRAAESGERAAPGNAAPSGQGTYFAVAPEYPTYAELGRMLRELLGRPRAVVWRFSRPVAWCVAGATELYCRCRGRAEDLNVDKLRDALASSWACSGDKARRELGFVPPKPLADRLQETIDWYAAAGWL
jgi:nucleoside-diphosphate-sugar epimerase